MDSAARTRNIALIAVAAIFTAAFVVVVIPPLADRRDFDVIGALGDGFVNPFAAGYALDIFFSYTVLLIWVVYEAVALRVRRGWIALILGFVPGVAVGLAAYLLIRASQVRETPAEPVAA